MQAIIKVIMQVINQVIIQVNIQVIMQVSIWKQDFNFHQIFLLLLLKAIALYQIVSIFIFSSGFSPHLNNLDYLVTLGKSC